MSGNRQRIWLISVLFAFLLQSQFAASSLPAFTSDTVLILVNDNSPASREIAQYYQKMRDVPSKNLCHLNCPEDEEIDRQTFDKQIRDPVVKHLRKNTLENKILYVVTTSGVPLKIKGSGAVKEAMPL